MKVEFRNAIGEAIYRQKYQQTTGETWGDRARIIANEIGYGLMSLDEIRFLEHAIANFWFLPGGRYIYYAGRQLKAYNNCYLLRAEEDTREEWAQVLHKATSCLMLGGGIGVDYSRLRAKGTPLSRTGGTASGPIPLMLAVNELGRNVMQGGSRRSAIYASLNWQHADAAAFLTAKNWDEQKLGDGRLTHWEAKQHDFNHAAPLDMTNISLNYDNAWRNQGETRWADPTFLKNVEQAMRTGEPGFSFNFDHKQDETLRNACTEVTSADDSDVCNLGSINMAAIPDFQTFRDVVTIATKFLLCGTLKADLPYEKVYRVREKNRRLGLGLMGMHEWMLKNGQRYEMSRTLEAWLAEYRDISDDVAAGFSQQLGISCPVAVRAIAPTGTIAMLAGTTTGVEPVYAVSYRRRYLKNGTEWHYQNVVDSSAEMLIQQYGLDPDTIETAGTLAQDPERRIRFQYLLQNYVDQSISSTVNLPAWGSEHNNPDKVAGFARVLSLYAPGLRGITFYPDGARGGQPITAIPYKEAKSTEGVEFREHDICDITGKGGVCGV